MAQPNQTVVIQQYSYSSDKVCSETKDDRKMTPKQLNTVYDVNCNKKNTENVTPAVTAVNVTKSTDDSTKDFKAKFVWRNIIIFTYLHLAGIYGLYLAFTQMKFATFLFTLFYAFLGSQGITTGAHRLWAHKAYKAKWPLRFILMICNCIAFQNSIYEWVRDHRVHHKFTDTTADPHNSLKGFFFSHMGWLIQLKHPDVKRKGKAVDMTDLTTDSIVMFQHRHYLKIMPIFCFILPTLIGYYCLNESMATAWYFCAIFRYTASLHSTWTVNSIAHIWGMKPYDRHINPTNNSFVSLISFGEGWHNYHHVFPWDYKASEYGNYKLNLSCMVIDFFAKIGWAYDLKTVSTDVIRNRILRTGDGSHEISQNGNDDKVIKALKGEPMTHMIWGWDDKDIQDDEKKYAKILNHKSI